MIFIDFFVAPSQRSVSVQARDLRLNGGGGRADLLLDETARPATAGGQPMDKDGLDSFPVQAIIVMLAIANVASTALNVGVSRQFDCTVE
jgi:hypothetical protein